MDASTAILGVAVFLFTLAGGYVLGRAISGMQGAPARRLPTPILEDPGETRRTIRRLEQENSDLTLFFVTLPDLVKQLQANREKRFIAPLLIRALDVIFEPRQSCVFYCTKETDCLKLVTSKGLPRALEEEDLVVRFDEGHIGWVARHQMVMDAHDLQNAASRIPRGRASTTGIQLDLCAALVDADDNSTIGVITVGRPSRYPPSEKKMIKMVADLGSMAIKQSEQHQHTKTLANQDGLTQLYNKRFGTDQFSLAINTAEQENTPLSLFMFDIDHFKAYNDTNGHLEGDEILRQIGKLVKSSIRSEDIAVRFGGEEFLVIFRDTDKEGALVAAEKIRRKIESFPFEYQEKQPGGNLTISGGVSSFREDARSSTEMIRLADAALYEAKERGRNMVLACRTRYLSEEPRTSSAAPLSDAR
ncbi:MAG: diguanylate cyclase [Acidobacteriota bacterium]